MRMSYFQCIRLSHINMTASTTLDKMRIRNKVDWGKSEERLDFETELRNYRLDLKARSSFNKTKWFAGIFIVQFLIILSLYGPCAYFIVSIASDKKEKEELIMLEKCNNRSLSIDLAEENCGITMLEYYDLENYLLINVYPFLTAFCQGTAFLCVCLWHVTSYRWWNFLGGVVACLCLPVDMLIFYVEPLGFIGTTVVMVLGFVPFCIIMADAAFPIKPMVLLANGKLVSRNRNSWTEDYSISYNQRFNFVARVTWAGWKAFSTIALGITLLKGSSYNEVALGTVVLVLEGMPGIIRLALTMIHWESSFDHAGFELFDALVDIPLVLWYLTFYSSPRTKNAVIGKLLLNSISIFIQMYAEYVEKYLYNESYDIKETEEKNLIEIRNSNRGMLVYDNSKMVNVCVNHILYTAACPFFLVWETFKVLKESFIRDFK